MATSPRYAATLLANNAGNVATANEFLRIVDAFLGGARVKDRDLLTPPGSPADGDLYLLPSSGTLTGDWAGFTLGNFALYSNGAWLEITVDAAMEGCTIRVVDEEVKLTYADEDGWVEVQNSNETGMSAAGTTQGTATAITKHVSTFSTVVAASADGAILPAARVGDSRVVFNIDSADTLKLYPSSGGEIDALGTNNPLSIAAGSKALLFATAALQWRSLVV